MYVHTPCPNTALPNDVFNTLKRFLQLKTCTQALPLTAMGGWLSRWPERGTAGGGQGHCKCQDPNVLTCTCTHTHKHTLQTHTTQIPSMCTHHTHTHMWHTCQTHTHMPSARPLEQSKPSASWAACMDPGVFPMKYFTATKSNHARGECT